MEKLRWGLLSTARINRSVIPPIRRSRRSELAAVASRDRATAEAYARKWGIPRLFGSYEAMLDDPDISAVYISVPNHLHAEWSIKCAAAGKHVLCEKPLALSTIEVDQIIEAARKYRVVIAEAFMYKHHPQTLKVIELVKQGAVGDLLVVKGAFTFNLTNPGDVRLYPEMGGGSIWDVGCYPISFARLIAAAEPVEVFGQQVLGPSGVDEVFAGQMRFSGGLLAQFESGFRSPYRTGMEIVGSEGSILVARPFKPESDKPIEVLYGDRTESIQVPDYDSYGGEIEDMENAALDGAPQRIPIENSRANVAVITAFLESARTGNPVMLEKMQKGRAA
ncbi:MAG: Gfo/Idh/MocA family oxidoreductase [Chitinivibrionales bacterium]